MGSCLRSCWLKSREIFQTWYIFFLWHYWLVWPPHSTSQSPGQPDLSLDLLLKLSGINSSWLPLLPAERRDPSLFLVQFPDLFLDLLLRPSGINRNLLLLPSLLPPDPFPCLALLTLPRDLLLRPSGINSS